MHWADINAALYKAGSSPGQIAAHENTQPSFVSRVIRGQDTSYRIASYLSVVTGIPLSRLFPDGRYDTPPPPGGRKPPQKNPIRRRGADLPARRRSAA